MNPKDLRYRYLVGKPKGKIHIVKESWRTYCKVENTSAYTASRLTDPLDYTEIPSNKRICSVCTTLLLQHEHESTNGRLDAEYRAIMQ